MSTEKCTWMQYSDEGDWETACGSAFCLTEGTPSDNKMKFCPYCGGELVEFVLEEEQEES